MKTLITLGFLVVQTLGMLHAQPYVEGGNTRHRFAQLNLGSGYRYLSSNNTRTYNLLNGEAVPSSLNHQNEMALIIGGTHFWGHADFYVLFPIARWGQSGFSSGVETGMKLYLWRIENNKIRPYIGTSFNSSEFQQGEGVTLSRRIYPFHMGLTYNKGQHLIDIGMSYLPKNDFNYYFNTLSAYKIHTPNLWFNMSYKYMLETTLSAEKSWKDGSAEILTNKLSKQGLLNGFTLAIGPSSAYFTARSSFNDDLYPFLDNHKFADAFPEFGLGYYWHNIDVQANISYRRMKDKLTAYGHEQISSRRAITLEVYKFLVDYHGFVVFVGPAISYELLRSKLKLNNTTLSSGSFNGVKPGIIFGWDIRPNRLQSFILRTNLRYFPNLNIPMSNGKKVALDNLEFNFIQLVVYPERMFGK